MKIDFSELPVEAAFSVPFPQLLAVKTFSDRDIGRHARKAAQIMEERGWTAGAMESPEGRVCALGAFRRAISPVAKQVKMALMDQFNARFTWWLQDNHPARGWLMGTSVAHWNDQVLGPEILQWIYKFADAMDPQ